MSHDSDGDLLSRRALHVDVLAAGLGAAEALDGNAGHQVIVLVKSAAGPELLRRAVHGDSAGDADGFHGDGGGVHWDGESKGEDGENVGELGEHHNNRSFGVVVVFSSGLGGQLNSGIFVWQGAGGLGEAHCLVGEGQSETCRKLKSALGRDEEGKKKRERKCVSSKRLSYIRLGAVLSRYAFTGTRTSTSTTWPHPAAPGGV